MGIQGMLPCLKNISEILIEIFLNLPDFSCSNADLSTVKGLSLFTIWGRRTSQFKKIPRIHLL